MSVHATAYVWEHSGHKGTELLLLLAIADFSSKSGFSYPSLKTLAKFIRMSERNTQRVLQKLVASGELRIKAGEGPNGTHIYQVVMNTTLPLFADERGGDKMTPVRMSGDIPAPEGVTNRAERGDTATSPEPFNLKKNRNGGGATPSPVAQCFAIYAEGIKKRYGGEYPRSAKANGQLAQLVARVGAEAAVAVTRFYIESDHAWYKKVSHSLDFLLQDCERLWLQVQKAGGKASTPPTSAHMALLSEEGRVLRDLGERPLADPESVARAGLRDYSRMVAALNPRHVEVRIGQQRHRFSVNELQGAR